MENDMTMGYVLGQSENKGCCNNGSMFGGNFLESIIGLAIFGMIWGGNGGFFGGGGQNGVDTRQAVYEGFQMNNLEAGVRGIQQGLCDGFYAVNTGMLTGFNGVQGQLANMSAQNQACCCETQRLVERGFADTNYNLATQECQTRQAIADAGRAAVEASDRNARMLYDYMVNKDMQTLRDKVQTLELNNTISAYANNNNSWVTAEANRLRAILAPTPVPSYQVPNPNAVYYGGFGYNGGCGCCA